MTEIASLGTLRGASWYQRGIKSFGCVPAENLSPVGECAHVDTKVSTGVGHAAVKATMANSHITRNISALNGGGCPNAISRTIGPVAIFPFDCTACGSVAHILKKLKKIIPFGANSNPARSVIAVVNIFWVIASRSHLRPASMERVFHPRPALQTLISWRASTICPCASPQRSGRRPALYAAVTYAFNSAVRASNALKNRQFPILLIKGSHRSHKIHAPCYHQTQHITAGC